MKMRMKTVPRHLPRKPSSAMKHAMASDDSQVVPLKKQKCQQSSAETLTTAVEDVAADGGSCKQEEQEEEEEEEEEEALDLSASAPGTPSSTSSAEDCRFKDSYLYRLMTDPQSLQQASRDSRLAPANRAAAAAARCPYCKREFAGGAAELEAHLRLDGQAEGSSLRCCACGKSFAQKRYLRYHQRSHSERSKYACELCTRKYSRLDNLTRHNIFHTNPDKFPCGSCERAFARKDLLNKHLRCHENRYKHHCHLCQKYFKGKLSLDNHRKLFHATAATAQRSDLVK